MNNSQWGYGNFSPYARSYEYNSYDCYGNNRLGARNVYNDISCKIVPRNEIKNEGNYVKIDERFHKGRRNVERYHDIMIIMSIAMVVRTCIMSIMIVIAMEVENHEGQRQGQGKVKFVESSMGEKSTKIYEHSQVQNRNEEKIQSQFFIFLTTTCGTKPNHGMKAKEEGMGKELNIGYEDTSISLSLNPSLLCHEFSFKELKLFLELYVSYVTSVGNVTVNPFTCDKALDVYHMLQCSSPCVYLDKQLFDSVARIKPSYHDLQLLHDNLFFDLLVVNFSSSCAFMRSKIHIFFRSFVERGYNERVSWFS
ncbi:hypothetical protein M9H77_03307 [Catharanthus roseus]|uniref:Uncharacterized protein n=1 Tax=Catharanthus roseus TaxID=4058 RepID=A0ACC0CBB0_CATRO|nr:hypothetical protein M9H77_03307 [Catharanthus roseus]